MWRDGCVQTHVCAWCLRVCTRVQACVVWVVYVESTCVSVFKRVCFTVKTKTDKKTKTTRQDTERKTSET